MAKKSGLGKGLDALLPAAEDQFHDNGIRQIPIGNISPNPRQPRANFNSEELDELAISIREHGVIQPLLITAGETPGSYILIAGERRLLAAKSIDMEQVPAIIREASDQELVELALIENVQREDLGPLETAEAYRQLNEDFGLSHEEIAARVGKSRTTITNSLRLFNLADEVKQALASGKISEGHARALLSLNSEKAQAAVLDSILKQTLNVRQTEQLVRKLGGEKPEKRAPTQPDPEVKALEEQLRQRLGTKVSLNQKSRGGTLTIHYYSAEELDALIAIILED
ncbi:MAG: ParB/RepB/Spo0J family partition protein [Anaerolineales bacterium]|nr:ParB/RepB/Spo0J family partition protein [Anaerolineales bacterium]